MVRVKQILLDFAKEYKWRYVAGFIFLMINSVITSLVPKIIGAVTDSIAEARPPSVIYKYVVLLLLSAFGTFIFRFIWRYLIIGNSRNLECHLRAKLFKHLQTLPVVFFDNKKTGDLVAYAINDIQAIRRTLAFGLVGILDGIVINSISIWLMIETINPIVSLMALAPAPLVVFIIIILRKKIREKFGEVQKAFASISEKVQENITGIRVIKAFAQEKEEMNDFTKYSKHRIDTQMKLTRVSAALGPITQICFGLSFVFFIIYGSDLVARGIISLGDFVAFNTYIGVIMRPIINVGRIVEIWQQGIASGKRLDEIFSVESESDLYKIEERYNRINSNNKKLNDGDINEDENRKKDLIKLKGRIEFKNLNFTYPGTTRRVLKDINLELKEGQTLGILGKTGSGKTTLVNLLLKLYEVDDGNIFIDGKDINKIPADILRENIGYVPQDNFLFSTSIKENIEFFRPIYDDEEIVQASKMAGVYDDIISFPDGFNTVVGERGVTLSGGQKQRVSIARAIIKDPPILILDDSLSAVDTKTEEEILKNIKEVLRGRTGIIISHRVSTVKHADQIIFMDNGQIVEKGTHDELMNLKGNYYRLYVSQTEDIDDNNGDDNDEEKVPDSMGKMKDSDDTGSLKEKYKAQLIY
ncbi:MAG TPA: ABC transporter ATP-binding protein [Clostridiaceae bacterium]|nr:ABC transporter ATP-binding protein [Clostridiaceae bacterium]